MTTPKLQYVNERVCAALDELSKLFVPGVKFSVTARVPGKPDQDFMVTNDDLDELIKLIERRRDA